MEERWLAAYKRELFAAGPTDFFDLSDIGTLRVLSDGSMSLSKMVMGIDDRSTSRRAL